MLRKSSIGSKFFLKLSFLVKISKISKNLGKIENFHEGGRSCSTSYPSGNQVDGSPLVAILKPYGIAPEWSRAR